MVEHFQKGRRLADVFDWVKSFGRAFSKARAGGGSGALLAVAVDKTLVNLFQKRRCSADVFAFLFGESRPLFKGAWAAFLFAKLFLCACGVKEKAGVGSWCGSRVSVDVRPSPSRCNRDTSPKRGFF